jgi:hypothetical protein
VLAFVSVNVWRSFVSCQIFHEPGSIERKIGNERPSMRSFEIVERVHKKLRYDQNKVMYLRNLSTKMSYVWKWERTLHTACALPQIYLNTRYILT